MRLVNPIFRPFAWCITVSIVIGALIAGCNEGYDNDRDMGGDPARSRPMAANATSGDPSSLSASAQRGKQLFQSQGCMGCHTVNGQGGNIGPDLSNEGNSGHSRQWLQMQIRNPKEHDPQTAMPAFNNLSSQQVSDLVAYLESLKTEQGRSGDSGTSSSQQAGAAAASSTRSASEVTAGGELWSRTCGECHNLRPPSEYSDAQWAVAVHHMRVRVPLTGREQKEILDFLQASN